MKKLTLIISLCLLVGCAVAAPTTQVQVKKLTEAVNKNEADIQEAESKLDKLSSRFNNLEYAVDKQKDIIAQEQATIENGLASSSRHLDMFALLIALGGIFLGWYISRKEKAMQKLLEDVTRKQEEITVLKNEVDTKKNDVESLKQDVDETSAKMQKLNDDINNDIEGLYQRLRREETRELLNRLVKVPFDIDNLLEILISRILQLEDFDTLLTAYTSLKQECEDAPLYEVISQVGNIQRRELSSKGKYLILFYQNFCGESMLNNSIREDVIEFLPYALECAFKSDIIISLTSLINVLNENNIQGRNEEILAQYIIALCQSDKSTYNEPYKIIVDTCDHSINLRNVWDQLVQFGVAIEAFGNLLCDRYKEDAEFITKVKKQIEISKNAEAQKRKADQTKMKNEPDSK